MKKILDFIKYNNAAVLILAAVFLLTSGTFAAQTEAGREFIGQKQTRVEGVDNTLLLNADLDNLQMDFKIEKIEEDEQMYYATYTFLDLDKMNSAWQYQLKEKTRKVSKKSDGDLGEYLLKEFHQQYEQRIKELKEEKAKAEASGEEKRTEITEYGGLIGKTLDLAGRVIPGYEPLKKMEVVSPEAVNMTYGTNRTDTADETDNSAADNLTDVYNNFIEEHANEINQLNATDAPADTPQAAPGETADTTEPAVIEETATSTKETAAIPEEAATTSEPDVEVIELPE